MSRYHMLTMLTRYAERFPEESEVVHRITALIERRSDCCHRVCRPGHLTASAWVVSRDRKKVGLVHHKKLGKWLQPGGHADGDSDLAGVAWREATEELGLRGLRLLSDDLPLDVDVHDIPAHFDEAGNLVDDAHEHHDVRFLLVAEGDEQLIVSNESHQVRWIDIDHLEEYTRETSVLRMAEKVRRMWG